MARVYGAESGATARVSPALWQTNKTNRRWRVWVYTGLVGFATWVNVARVYYLAHFCINGLRGQYGWGDTDGTTFSLLYVSWAAFEWLPYYLLEYEYFWHAVLESTVLFGHVGIFVAYKLFQHDFFDVEKLRKQHILLPGVDPLPAVSVGGGATLGAPHPAGTGALAPTGATPRGRRSSLGQNKKKD